MISKTAWENPDTVRQYHNFSESCSMYRTTSQDLVTMAEIDQGMSVVDLACGTGITTEMILKRLLDIGEVYSVDFSQRMLDIARSRISCPRVIFVHGTAECLDRHIPMKIDRVVCNSAIWQTNMQASFKAVSRILKENGKFAFNIGIKNQSFPNHYITHMRVLFQMICSIAKNEYNYSNSKQSLTAALSFDGVVSNLLEKSGLSLESKRISNTILTFNEAREFLLIPGMTEYFLSGLPYNKRKEIVEKACQEFDLTTTFTFTWMNYLVKKVVSV